MVLGASEGRVWVGLFGILAREDKGGRRGKDDESAAGDEGVCEEVGVEGGERGVVSEGYGIMINRCWSQRLVRAPL